MSDKDLKKNLIKKAHANPELRPTVFKILANLRAKEAAPGTKVVNYGESKAMFDNVRDMLKEFTNYMMSLRFTADALHDLVTASEDGRYKRSENVDVTNLNFDGKSIRGNTKSKGGSDTYLTQITLQPKRGFNCTCEDKSRHGKWEGPCKHTIALGRVFWEDDLQNELNEIENAFGDLMDKLKLLK